LDTEHPFFQESEQANLVEMADMQKAMVNLVVVAVAGWWQYD